MFLRNLVLLISIVGFSTSSSTIRPQRLSIEHLLPEPTKNVEVVSNRTEKKLNPESKAPQMEIYLKSYNSSDENSSEKWAFSNEYKYSDKDYDAVVTPMTDKKKVLQVENDDIDTKKEEKENSDDVQDIVMPDELDSQIGFRNIITVPTYCPEGQRVDNKGHCRTIIKTS